MPARSRDSERAGAGSRRATIGAWPRHVSSAWAIRCRRDTASSTPGSIPATMGRPFVIHWWTLHSFQRSIETFRNRLAWVYRSYFSEDERAGLDLRLEPRAYWYEPEVYIGLIAISFVGAVLTAVYLWSVR